MRIPTDLFFTQQMTILSNQYQDVLQTLMTLSSNSKLLASSDNPVLASQIKLTQNYLSNLQSYDSCIQIAQNRTQLSASAMESAVPLMQSVQDLITQASNGTYNDAQRNELGITLQGYINNLLASANTQDGSGQYIYSGYNSTTPAYALINGSYQYQGSYESTSVNLSENTSVVYGDSGESIFGNNYLGNGTFTVTAQTTNTGTAYTDPGNVYDLSSYVSDTYTISFNTNSSGQTVYQVVGAQTGQVIPVPPLSGPDQSPVYQENSSIQFNGMSIDVHGAPNAGDTFVVAPSTKDNIFNILTSLVNTLETPLNNDPALIAQFKQTVTQAMTSLQGATANLVGYQSEVGTRMSVVMDQQNENQQSETVQEDIYSSLHDVDEYAAFTLLSEQKLALMATQGSYSQLNDLFMQLLKL